MIGEGQGAEVSSAVTSFRIFRAGNNPCLGGENYVFDAQAARDVMAARALWAVDVMIDDNHRSVLDKNSPQWCGDAMGWCTLGLRGAELWAENVRWTAEGRDKLVSGKARYSSPTMYYDEGTFRVESIFNLAITATPKTLNAERLIATNSAALASLGASKLTKSEREACRDLGCTEANFLRAKAMRGPAVVKRASLGAGVPWNSAIDPQLMQIAKERNLQGGMTSVKEQIQAQNNRDNQLADIFGTTAQQIETTRKRLGLGPDVQLSLEELQIAEEMGCLPAVFEILKAQRNARS